MKILRWVVPVDDADHLIPAGRIVHVDCRAPDAVTFWADEDAAVTRTFRVFGTGQPIPDGWQHVGTALSPGLPPFAVRGDLVWHLFEQGTP